jgi:hypothetical protein
MWRSRAGAKIKDPQLLPVADGKGSSGSALSGLLLVLGSLGGLALLGWLTVVMLDLKHLNTGGFTLP